MTVNSGRLSVASYPRSLFSGSRMKPLLAAKALHNVRDLAEMAAATADLVCRLVYRLLVNKLVAWLADWRLVGIRVSAFEPVLEMTVGKTWSAEWTQSLPALVTVSQRSDDGCHSITPCLIELTTDGRLSKRPTYESYD